MTGPAGNLEGDLWLPEGTPRAAIALGHPHPEHGGSMASNVVYRAARALQQARIAVLRLNYRGVGASEGVHDGGRGEEQDHAAALQYLREQLPQLPLWVGGYSFGARVAAALAVREPDVRQVLLIALPVLAYPCEVAAGVRSPGLVLMAGEDGFGTGADLRRTLPSLLEHLELEEISGVDHFFKSALPELGRRVGAWAERVLGDAQQRP